MQYKFNANARERREIAGAGEIDFSLDRVKRQLLEYNRRESTRESMNFLPIVGFVFEAVNIVSPNAAHRIVSCAVVESARARARARA